MDKPEFVMIGERETGLAVRSVTTSKGTITLPDGTKKQMESKMERRVTEFEEGPLDPALFEIPPSFKQVDHFERNPESSTFVGQVEDFLQRVKAEVERLF